MRRLGFLFCWLALGASGWAQVCRVTVLGNEVGQPDDPKDGLLLMRVFVSTSTSCQNGEVEVAVFPASVCRKRPQADIDDSKPMTFSYKPNVAKIEVAPGNIGSGVVEISSGDAGSCVFNSVVASCGSVVPAGGECERRGLTDPQPEMKSQGGVEREFHRLR